MILPRAVFVTDRSRSDGYSYSGCSPTVVQYEYEIFDGERFVALNSSAGQKVIADLS
jgi:hypothetical protein